MTAIEIMNGRPESGGYKVDVSRGRHDGRVSSEWFSRPDDEKYLSLSELYASVKGRAERSKTRTVESAAIRVEAHRDDPEKLALVLPDAKAPLVELACCQFRGHRDRVFHETGGSRWRDGS